MESHPKWDAITAILKEIAAESTTGITLIVASQKKVGTSNSVPETT